MISFSKKQHVTCLSTIHLNSPITAICGHIRIKNVQVKQPDIRDDLPTLWKPLERFVYLFEVPYLVRFHLR